MIHRVVLDNVNQLNLEKFGPLLSHLSDTLDRDLSRQVDTLVTCPAVHLYVTPSLQDPQGCATLWIEPKLIHHGASVGHLEDLVVHPDARGHGLAQELVRHAITEAKSRGCYKVMLHCDVSLLPFYRQFGFDSNDKTQGMRLDLL